MSWADDHDALKADTELYEFANRHPSLEAMAKTGLHAHRGMTTSYRIPDELDKLSEEDRTNLTARAKRIVGVPDKADAYEIGDLPEGIDFPDELQTQIREAALAGDVPAGGLGKVVKTYMDYLQQADLASNEQRTAALNQFKKELGPKADVVLGKKNADGTIELGTAQRAAMQLSEQLGMDYKDEQGTQKSHLLDCLDATQLGDRIPLVKVFQHLWDTLYAEGEPVLSSGDAMLGTDSFFDYTDMD